MNNHYSNFHTVSDGTTINYSTNFHPDHSDQGFENILIFNYGLVCSNHHWREQLPFFDELGYKILIHNYRGHFESSGIDNIEKITFKRIAEDLSELCEHLNIRSAIILGHSMGVNVSLEFATIKPEILKGMVLISGTVKPVQDVMFDSNVMSFVIPLLDQLNKLSPSVVKAIWNFSGRSGLIRFLIHQAGFNAKNVPVEFVEKYLQQVAELGPNLFIQLFQQMGTHDVVAKLPRIQVPTLVIGGDKDDVVPSHQQKLLCNLLPHSKMHIMKNGSHVPQVDFPDFMNEILYKFVTDQLGN